MTTENNSSHSEDKDANEPRESELIKTVHNLSRAAFQLAQDSASGEGDKSQNEAKAREMNKQLDELVPRIREAPPEDQANLQSEWTDARQDLNYVLSGGALPTSIRMFHYLRSLE